MKTCILSYHWKLDICNYEAFIKHRIVSIVKVVPTKMLSSFWGGAIAPAVPIAFPSVLVTCFSLSICLVQLLYINPCFTYLIPTEWLVVVSLASISFNKSVVLLFLYIFLNFPGMQKAKLALKMFLTIFFTQSSD